MSARRHGVTAGFGLVEILITSAILGVLVLAFNQFLGGALKAQKNVQNAVDFDLLKTNLNLVLGSKACNGAFRQANGSLLRLDLPTGVTWNTLVPGAKVVSPTAPLPIGRIQQGSSTIVEAMQNRGGGLEVRKLEFQEATYDGEQTVVDPATGIATIYRAFVAQLRVEAVKLGAIGLPTLGTNVAVRLLVNDAVSANAGTVEKCSTPGGASSTVKMVDGVVDDSAFGAFIVPGTVTARVEVANPFPGKTRSVRWYAQAKVGNNGYAMGDRVYLDSYQSVMSYTVTGFSDSMIWLTRGTYFFIPLKFPGGTHATAKTAEWTLHYQLVVSED